MAEKEKEGEVVAQEGAFKASLQRNNKQIREDRALSITEDAQMLFKRKIEDLSVSVKRMKRDRESMLDLSPENTTTLKMASDFDAEGFVTKDIELGVKIRNAEITLEIATERYNFLFGTI